MRTRERRLPRRLARNPAALLGLIVLAAVVASAVGAPLFAPYAPTQVVVSAHLLPPFATASDGTHLLGTDGLGRDILTRILYGSRVSLLVAVVAVAVGGVVGTLLGLVAGYRGGAWDGVIMRLVDVQLSLPFLVLAIAIVAVLGNGVVNVVIALVVTSWTEYARVVRAEVLSLREREYVAAARASGARDAWILLRHLLPNVAPSLSVITSLEVGHRILTQASLSYLGLGVPPEMPDWGRMVAEGQKYIFDAWWVSLFPGLAILLTVLALNIVGDWIRDELDPKYARRS